ncbi:CBO0543 family protein [Cytobacillus sp. NCCP-133]|uniref:CBO0543 family protein n=1 Tax=Cytobacillus sp. NCCP-133 TaxID=766848 RepID=UPI002230250E|nr:CBO0543 family protein [Cytobacillus sp. NCCP-133]GLB61601.1 hypothetical protein NCCP133_37300 [Cytobacillus sp. NCCP-133]
MNTVKHLKDSSSQLWQKKPSRFGIKRYIPAMLLASLLGTYLDLYYVGKQLYHFPIRPLPSIFSIHIGFTLVALPITMIVILNFLQRCRIWLRILFVLCLSLLMAVMEKAAENMGLFVHAEEWNHMNTFAGYCLFIGLIYAFHGWMNRERE